VCATCGNLGASPHRIADIGRGDAGDEPASGGDQYGDLEPAPDVTDARFRDAYPGDPSSAC